MPNWTESMQQTYEYYIVDPLTWKDTTRLATVTSCGIDRDSEAETLGSATIEMDEFPGECYIRAYLITIQNGLTEKHPLSTFLIQSPSTSFNGVNKSLTIDAYTPLLELKETMPPIGYSRLKGERIMDAAYQITRENVRAPIVEPESNKTLPADFVADPSEKWITFLIDLMKQAKYSFGLDEMGRILFCPDQDTASLQPVWTYDDGNSSILYPDLTLDKDIYGIPNVVEVIYSKNNKGLHARVVNKDKNSPTSTVNRGREIVHRVVDPDFGADPEPNDVKDYANRLLKELSTIKCTVTYTHGYCPVRLGDCVRLNYPKAGLDGVKAKVISQSIKCEPGCPVTEKAVYTAKLWNQ